MTPNTSINEKIDSADLVIAVKDGEFEIIKARYASRGRTTLPELQRLLAGEAKRND